MAKSTCVKNSEYFANDKNQINSTTYCAVGCGYNSRVTILGVEFVKLFKL